MQFNDWMVDIETTGLRPDRNAILAIGAVKFDRITFTEVGKRFFTRMVIPPTRFWDESTRAWWAEQRPEAFAEATSGVTSSVTRALLDFQVAIGVEAYCWAKPVQFDWNFIESYYHEFGSAMLIPNPFSYRRTVDVRSYIMGMGPGAVDAANTFVPEGIAHTVHADCLHALGMLREAKLAATQPPPDLDAAFDLGPDTL